MPVSNGVLDTVGFLFAGQLAYQLQRKGDGTAQTVAGGEVAVHHDLFIVDDGTGQLILEPGVGRGVFALQQAQRGQNAGGGADGGYLLPAAAKALQVSVTVLLAARLGVPGMPPGSTTRSTSE